MTPILKESEITVKESLRNQRLEQKSRIVLSQPQQSSQKNLEQ